MNAAFALAFKLKPTLIGGVFVAEELAGHAGYRCQFRCRGSCRGPAVARLATLGQLDMPIIYTIDQEEKLITEVWTGEVNAEDLAAYWKRYLKDPDVLAIRRTIVDLRQANMLFTGAELDGLIQSIVLPALQGRDWKTALVVESPLQRGVSRQYQHFAHYYSKDAIFHNLEDARNWLNKIG
jgi:hypothetical protein